MREWLLVVGVIYVAMGIRLQPFLNARQFRRVMPGWQAPPSTVEFQAIVDWMGTFGMDLVAIGVVAIAAASFGEPAGWPLVVWVIVAREILGGVISDLPLILHGYANRVFYAGFIVFHLVVIASGLLVLT